jgi:hypothetical protein
MTLFRLWSSFLLVDMIAGSIWGLVIITKDSFAQTHVHGDARALDKWPLLKMYVPREIYERIDCLHGSDAFRCH